MTTNTDNPPKIGNKMLFWTVGLTALYHVPCCLLPMLGMLSLSMGHVLHMPPWFEAMQPIFVTVNLLGLGYLWFRHLTHSSDHGCQCHLHSHTGLIALTAFAVSMLVIGQIVDHTHHESQSLPQHTHHHPPEHGMH